MYQRFSPRPDQPHQTGWDAYADVYAKLLVPGTVYYLTKEVIHRQIADQLGTDRPIHVLDLNCGTGNDFPFFLALGWKITACDGSVGMLNKACEKYGAEIASGRITLFHGQMETLDAQSFDGAKFDLIYSVTGGYAYIADDTMCALNAVLGSFLAEGGLMVTAHLNKFCLSDLLYQLAHLRPKLAFIRHKRRLMITVKGQELRMYLRGPAKVRRLTPSNLLTLKVLPLLWLTPPYQTGYRPSPTVLRLLRAVEMSTRHLSFLSILSDQVVAIARRAGR